MIRVKFMTRGLRHGRTTPSSWLRHFPGGRTVWGNCEYTMDYQARAYDWLVVYSEFPPIGNERFSLWEEVLACPRERTIFIMNEPSSIKVYGSDFLKQFGWVITAQEPEVVNHPGAIFKQSGYRWFYGAANGLGYDEMAKNIPIQKTSLISTVCSAKRQKHTLHAARYDFTWQLKKDLPELEIYGRGVRPIDDKAEALDSFRYHLAIENFSGPHHWSEKLSDAFLGLSLPFYHGCPNAADYFPKESLVPINIRDYAGSLKVIRQAISEGWYEQRLPALLEARRRVMEEHQLFAMVSREIEARHGSISGTPVEGTILSRQLLRRRKPWIAVRMMAEQFQARRLHQQLSAQAR